MGNEVGYDVGGTVRIVRLGGYVDLLGHSESYEDIC